MNWEIDRKTGPTFNTVRVYPEIFKNKSKTGNEVYSDIFVFIIRTFKFRHFRTYLVLLCYIP